MRACLTRSFGVAPSTCFQLGHYESTVEWRNSKRHFSRKFGACIKFGDGVGRREKAVALLAWGPFHAAFLTDARSMIRRVEAVVGWSVPPRTHPL